MGTPSPLLRPPLSWSFFLFVVFSLLRIGFDSELSLLQRFRHLHGPCHGLVAPPPPSATPRDSEPLGAPPPFQPRVDRTFGKLLDTLESTSLWNMARKPTLRPLSDSLSPSSLSPAPRHPSGPSKHPPRCYSAARRRAQISLGISVLSPAVRVQWQFEARSSARVTG